LCCCCFAKLENDSVLLLDAACRLDVDELEYVEKLDMEGILGGLGFNSDVGPSLEAGEALRFLELALDRVKVW